MTDQPSNETIPVSTLKRKKRWHKDKKSQYTPRWLWLLICLAGFLLVGCSNSPTLVNVTEEPLQPASPRMASILPPKWMPTPQQDIQEDAEPDSRLAINFGSLLRVREREIVVPHGIGYSVNGRPLEVYRFGDGQRDLLIVAGIHGGYEWNTIALADELIEHLKHNPQLIPPDVKLHILRSLNPDGEARAQNFLGRANANNVDLNRNWNVNWISILPQLRCWNLMRLSGGPYPISEPEPKALMRYILDADIEAIISYHSAGLGIFAGGIPTTEKSRQLAEAIAEVSSYPYPPIDIGCNYTGTFIDWAARIGVASVDVELSNHFNTDFEQNLRILETFLSWTPASR